MGEYSVEMKEKYIYIPALPWPKPGHWTYLGSEPADGQSLSLPVSVSFSHCLSAFQITRRLRKHTHTQKICICGLLTHIVGLLRYGLNICTAILDIGENLGMGLWRGAEVIFNYMLVILFFFNQN